MKDLKKILYIGLVIGIASLMCLQAGALSTTRSSIRNDEPILTLSGGDVLLSVDNPDGDDMNPKITRNNAGTIVVVYEKQVDIFSKSVNVLFSEDQGEVWDIMFNFDSIDFPEGSGILNTPDIVYSAESGGFYLQMIDPAAGMYNQEFAWFQEDIANAQDASWYGISGQGSTDYSEGAISNTGKWVAGMEIDSGHQTSGMGMAWFWYDSEGGEWLQPADYDANWAAGFYYDGESILTTHPAISPEMDSGSTMIYLVAQVDLLEGSTIMFKATPNDLDPNSDTFTFISGGGPGDMDKHADIEVWGIVESIDQKHIDLGTDPDVSASGNSAAVVYAQNGQIKCAYSSDRGRDMQTSTVASGGFPAVHMSGQQVTCAFVNDGNLFTSVSEDGGASWGSPMQVNEVDGTVAEEPGAVDICDLGIVWVDTRDGQKDIYAAGGASAPIIEVGAITGGMGVSTTVSNSGTADAEDIEVTITIDASLMIIGGVTTDTIDVAVGESVPVSTGFILGLGPATITVDAGGVIKTASGTVLGPFVIGL